jgi:hypothetical protein
MNSIADVLSVDVSRGINVGVGAEKVVLSPRAEAPVSRTAARTVKRVSNIAAMRPQQTNEVNEAYRNPEDKKGRKK